MSPWSSLSSTPNPDTVSGTLCFSPQAESLDLASSNNQGGFSPSLSLFIVCNSVKAGAGKEGALIGFPGPTPVNGGQGEFYFPKRHRNLIALSL